MRTEKNQINIKNQNSLLNDLTSKDKPAILNEDLKIFKFLLKHREVTRKKIVSTQISWPTVLAFLPLGVGVIQFFLTTTSSFNRDIYFRKTLPVFSPPHLKYTTETIEYIVKSNKIRANQNLKFFLSQPKFLTQLKTGSTSSFTLTSFLDFEKFTGLSSSFFDELPSYIEGLKDIDETNQKSGLVNNGDCQNTKTTSSKSVHNPISSGLKIGSNSDKKKSDEASTLKFFIESSDNKDTTIQCVLPSSKEKSTTFQVTNSFFKDRLDFIKAEHELNRELQSLFIEDEICLFTDLNEDETPSAFFSDFLKQNASIKKTVLVDTLLKNSKNFESSITSENCRLMSGYNYPDMTSQDLIWFFREKKIHQWLFKTPSSAFQPTQSTRDFVPNTSTHYNFRIKNFPKFGVKTQQVVLSDPVTGEILHDVESLVLNPKISYDWKPSKNLSLRSWFHQYISPLNPFTHRQENFFGIFESPKFSKEHKQEKLFELKSSSYINDRYESKTYHLWFHTPPKSLKNLLNPVVSTFAVPNRIDEQMTRFLSVPIRNDQGEIVKTYTLPILEIRQPVRAFQADNKDNAKKPFTEKVYSSRFDLGVTGKPDFNFPDECWNYTPYTTSTSSGDHYYRAKSVFLSSSEKSWREFWEPLSTESWLLLCQISFVVLTFQLLQNVIGNYGKELVSYILEMASLFGGLDPSVKEQIQLLIGERPSGYRIVPKTTKSFHDVVGVGQFLPELYELLWFLRNSGQEIGGISQTLPRGVLLTGPPGTGKTLLVQAIAGEAGVPVIVLSGSSLIEPGQSPALKLQMVFKEARFQAPCILFIDELDSLGQRRTGLVYSPMEHDQEILNTVLASDDPKKQELSLVDLQFGETTESEKTSALKGQVNQSTRQLGLLTKLLIELDGMQARDGVIVFGATNRPEALDPALLRPGRFEKFIEVGVPDHDKRIEILQFYGKNRGWAEIIPWDYIAARTVGFSAADLATLMNESTMKAIMTESQHTVKTIEHGIDRLTTSEIEKITQRVLKTADGSETILPFSISQKLEIVRLAYYQAAKIIVTTFLTHHPNSVVAALWPRRPTLRSLQLATNLRNTMFHFARLYELHDRVVGCYAGKAAEVLFVQKFSTRRSSHLSTLGIEELMFAQKLIYILIEKANFYSKKTHFQRSLPLSENLNSREFKLKPERINPYRELIEKMSFPSMDETLKENKSEYQSPYDLDYDFLNPEFNIISEQLNYSVPWWQLQTSNSFRRIEKNPGNWIDFYLFNPELNERNVQWLPPDEFYHTKTSLKYLRTAFLSVKKTSLTSKLTPNETEKSYPKKKVNLSWNEVSKITRDYPVHSLVLQSFNKAFKILNRNRSLLDRLVIDLISNEIIREPEINKLFKEFQKDTKALSSKQSQLVTQESKHSVIQAFEKENKLKVVEFSWGRRSRKPLPRWIDFSDLENSET